MGGIVRSTSVAPDFIAPKRLDHQIRDRADFEVAMKSPLS